MKITVDVLTQMGCKDRILYKDNTYQREYFFKMDGYEFVFEESKTKPGVWSFTAARGPTHTITDIEECFGLIATEFAELGKKEFKQDLKKFLKP